MKKSICIALIVSLLPVFAGFAYAEDVLKALPADSRPQAAVPQEGPVTPLDVMEMSKAGLADNVIISKIGSSGASFNLSVADIISLKKQGVSDPVINYMINTRNAPAAAISNAVPKATPVSYAAPVTYAVPAQTYYVNPAPAYYVYDYDPPVSVSFSYGSYWGWPYWGGPYWGGYRWGYGGYRRCWR